MKMFRGFMLAFGMLLAAPGFADINVPDVTKMSPEQVTMLKAQLDAVEPAPGTAASTASKVSEWAEVGKNISQGIVAAAKELGVEANAFAVTPLGKTTLVVLLWHFFGKSMLFLVMLFAIPFVFAPLVTRAMRRGFGKPVRRQVKSEYFGIMREREVIEYENNEGSQVALFISYAVMFVTWLVCLGNL